jgi:hypothetical protein
VSRTTPSWFPEAPLGSVASLAKLATARAVLAQGHRLVWTDDVETPTTGPVFEELAGPGRALLIAPSPIRGLQPEHLERIEQFLAH